MANTCTEPSGWSQIGSAGHIYFTWIKFKHMCNLYLWPVCPNLWPFHCFLWAILSAYQQVAGYKRLRMMTNCFVYIFSIVYYLLYKPFVKLLYSIFLPLIVSIYIDMFDNKCCFSTKHQFLLMMFMRMCCITYKRTYTSFSWMLIWEYMSHICKRDLSF